MFLRLIYFFARSLAKIIITGQSFYLHRKINFIHKSLTQCVTKVFKVEWMTIFHQPRKKYTKNCFEEMKCDWANNTFLPFLLRTNSQENVDKLTLASRVKIRAIKSCKIDMHTFTLSSNSSITNFTIWQSTISFIKKFKFN